MKFKFSVEFLVVVFLFISIMFISTYGSTKIMPFEPKSSKLPMYTYEGFEEKDLSSYPSPSPSPSSSNENTEIPDRMHKLQWGEYGKGKGNEKTIDIMSEQKSDPSCRNISNGLSNSKGYLCPTEDVQKLQRTRGGNSSGAPHQIGA